CKQIIEKHHGKIWFESQSGIGSTFYIRLPKPKKMDMTIIEADTEASKQKVS
ncbi:MAG: HAMP domain-containing histidine kinase, partial [Mucilaginibacter sp.]|nr:HAMP domain-containing histidine kinase [Mucilaginibacter sp.]